MSTARDHSDGQKAAAREIRATLHGLASAADAEHLDMLHYLLQLCVVETTEIIGDAPAPSAVRSVPLGKRE